MTEHQVKLRKKLKKAKSDYKKNVWANADQFDMHLEGMSDEYIENCVNCLKKYPDLNSEMKEIEDKWIKKFNKELKNRKEDSDES